MGRVSGNIAPDTSAGTGRAAKDGLLVNFMMTLKPIGPMILPTGW